MKKTYKVEISTAKGKKCGKIFEVYEDNEQEKQLFIAKKECPTFKQLSRALRKTGLIPTSIALKKKGTTTFERWVS
ncbi:MAG: hypothetical protein K9M15_02085 [Candidatus Marinimicrobia bacterium]|nr:hypothetical protein [Candidatus Neomarinimicrobiota bacterium]